MKKIYSINVAGKHGYSFAVECDANFEEEAIDMAAEAGLFDDPEDAEYATAEDITGSEYDINAFKSCTYKL